MKDDIRDMLVRKICPKCGQHFTYLGVVRKNNKRVLCCYHIKREQGRKTIKKCYIGPERAYSYVEILRMMWRELPIIVREKEKYTIVYFKPKETLIPETMRRITPPSVNTEKGVVLLGRGPKWVYSYLRDYYSSAKFVGVYVPWLEGAVIVRTNTPEFQTGDVIEISWFPPHESKGKVS